jgi:flagellar biosynthesis/type III secretory pathway protein FliH
MVSGYTFIVNEQIDEILERMERCMKQEPSYNSIKTELNGDMISRQAVKEQMIKYGFHAPDMTVSEFVESDIFDEIMDDESEDEETYEKIKEIIAKVKGAGDMKRPLHTDEKIATLTECEESYAKGYEDGRKAGHEAGYKAAHEAISNIIMRVLKEIKP